MLLEHLADLAACSTSTHGSADFLPHALLLSGAKGPLAADKVWERLTLLHLLAIKMWEHGSRLPASFVVGGAAAGLPGSGPLYRELSGRPGGWGPAQDFGLVRGVFLAG